MCFLDKYFSPAPQFVRKTDKRAKNKITKQSKSKPPGWHTFHVQKPYCCGAEAIIRNALEPYGIPITSYSEQTVGSKDMEKRMKIEQTTKENLRYGPVMFELYKTLAIEATFTVPKAQATWAEYLMESTGRLIVVDGKIDKRNRTWGEKRDGNMPVASDSEKGRLYARSKAGIKNPNGSELIEPGCTRKLEILSKAQAKGKNR